MRLGRHIAIIGAGVIGLAIAVRLRREGFRITLIDPNEPGSQTSSGNAALIMTAKATPHSEPGLWHKLPVMMRDQNRAFVIRPRAWPKLTPWFMRFMKNTSPKRYQELSEALAPMVTQALDAWASLLSPSDSARYLRKEGLLHIYRQRKNLNWGKKEAAVREKLGIPSEFIPGPELPNIEPELDSGLLGGILYPESGHTTDPAALSAALSIAYRTSGGEVRRTSVRALRDGEGGSVRVVMDDAEMDVDDAIVAAGIWSAPMVKPFGIKPMLAAERGYNLMLTNPSVDLQRPIMDGDHYFIMTSLEKGLRLAGTSEFAGVDSPPNWDRSDILLPLAQQILPNINAESPATRWMGPRPSTPDSLPLVGRIQQNPRIICAFGHGMLGLTLAPITAGQVADIISDREPEVSIEALNPNRF